MGIIYSPLYSSTHKYTPDSPRLFSVAVLNTMTKSHLGREVALFQLVGLSCEPDEQELREEPG